MSRENKTNNFETMLSELGKQIERTIRHIGTEFGNTLTCISEEIENTLEEVDKEIENALEKVDTEIDYVWDENYRIRNSKKLDLELVHLNGKLNKELELFKTDRYNIKLHDETIIIPVREVGEDKYCGGIILGKFKFLADMVLYTKTGAVGQSVERVSNAALFLTSTFPFSDKMEPIEESTPILENASNLLYQFLVKYNHLDYITQSGRFNIKHDEKPEFVFFFPQENTPNFWFIENEENLVTIEGKEILVITNDDKLVEVSRIKKRVHIHSKTKSLQIDPKLGIEIDFGIGKFSLSEFFRNLGENLRLHFDPSFDSDDWDEFGSIDEEE